MPVRNCQWDSVNNRWCTHKQLQTGYYKAVKAYLYSKSAAKVVNPGTSVWTQCI